MPRAPQAIRVNLPLKVDIKAFSAAVHDFKSTMYSVGTKEDEVKAIELLKTAFCHWWVAALYRDSPTARYADDLIPPRYEDSGDMKQTPVVVYIRTHHIRRY